MSRWVGGSVTTVAALVALFVAIAVFSSQSEVRANDPDVNNRLDVIEDELALARSQIGGVRDDLGLAREQLGGVRDELALVRNQLERLTRAMSSSASGSAEFTQAFVEEAINRYESTGREATIAHYNTMESVDGDWYVFIIDENGIFVSHATIPTHVGTDIEEVTGPDGYPVGLAIANSATEEGSWVDYAYQNPNSGGIESKHSWIVKHDGLIFGSGWYEDGPSRTGEPGEYTKAYVQRAIHLHDTAGRDAALAYYQTMQSVDGDWYLFVIGAEGKLVVHSTVPENVGQDLAGPFGTDVTGKDFGAEMLAATEEGRWVDYVFLNPANANQERKHSWVVKHEGLIYGSGWYERGVVADPKADPAAYTKAYVERAIQRYDAQGRDAALAYYNTPESIDGDWYMFIIDENDLIVSQGAVPARVGVDINARVAPNGYPHGLVISAAASEEGAWVDYVLEAPSTGEVRVKHSWLVRHEGLIFGSGWYEDGPSKLSEPAAYTKSFVNSALQLYRTAGREAAIAHYNTMESVDGDWYVFILDENDIVVSHATIPSLVGKTDEEFTGPDGYPVGLAIANSATEAGGWVDYAFQNPNAGVVEFKHSWIVKHDGLIFGSGWYEDGPSRTGEPGAYTKAYVQRATHLYDTAGRDAVLAYYQTMQSIDGDWYLFVSDENDKLIVHPTVPENLGQDLDGPLATDVTGKDFGAEMVAATEEGRWVDYVYANPANENKYERKHSWVIRHGGLLFGSGWYERNVEVEIDPAAYTKLVVYGAIRRYDAQGRDATIAYYNTPESIDGEWYLFIIDENDVLVAQAAVPANVGQDLKGPLGTDATGRDFSADVLAATEEGRWVDYVYLNPANDAEAQKHSWVVKHEGLIFGSGWYER